jgi:Flp pilus assembly protein CpaB
MKGKFLVIVAVVIGIVVVVMLNSTWKSYEEKLNVPMRTFYRATADVTPPMTVDQARALKLIVEEKSLPESFARSYPYAVDELQMNYQNKKRIERPIKSGEFLQVPHLEPLSGDEIKLKIPAGHTVVAIPVNSESSLGYLIAPGDLIDVVLITTGNDPKDPAKKVAEAKTVAADVRVFSVDALVGRADGVPVKPRGVVYGLVNVTLPDEEALKLMAAKSLGKLTLVLKSKKD